VTPLVDIVAEGLAAGRPIVRRAVHVRRENRSWHFGVTVSPLGDPASKQGAICLFSDLTTIVELEQQLQLKEALARLGELTAGIAHEFRNGLATIHGYSRLIDPQALPAKYQPYVEGIRAETNALGQVVTKFLEFARPQPAAFWPVELEPVIRRAADELRRELPADTSVNVSGTFGVVHGDELLLRQLFGNLIRNAAEACEAAGRTPMIGIAAQADTSGDMTIIAVEDNGPGIAEADRARIFQPFFTTRSRGSGLGLSIVQKIVLHHNGRVSVDSAPTGGARIQLTLPRAS
jgi:signal transduction histidine kinase